MIDAEQMSRKELLQPNRLEKKLYAFADHAYRKKRFYISAAVTVVVLILAIWGGWKYVQNERINQANQYHIARAMLTLFRVMTFEDWTDVMYETLEFHAWSWAYFVSFIFLTAFAFLNMVIGIVVNVLEEQHQKEIDEDPDQVSIADLYREIQSLKAVVEMQSSSNDRR